MAFVVSIASTKLKSPRDAGWAGGRNGADSGRVWSSGYLSSNFYVWPEDVSLPTATRFGTWTMFGNCAPGECPQPTGACCDVLTGGCAITTQTACQFSWLGAGVPYNVQTCTPPIPTERTSWVRSRTSTANRKRPRARLCVGPGWTRPRPSLRRAGGFVQERWCVRLGHGRCARLERKNTVRNPSYHGFRCCAAPRVMVECRWSCCG